MINITKDIPEDLDSDTASEMLVQAIKDLGLVLEYTYIPWSASRQAKEKPDTRTINKAWHWTTKVYHPTTPSDAFTACYSQGPGVTKTPTWVKASKEKQVCMNHAETLEHELQSGLVWFGSMVSSRKPVKPVDVDVFGSLCLDSDAVNYKDFADWAENLGFDSDSIKDKAAYDECIRTGLWMVRNIGSDNLAYLQTLANAR